MLPIPPLSLTVLLISSSDMIAPGAVGNTGLPKASRYVRHALMLYYEVRPSQKDVCSTQNSAHIGQSEKMRWLQILL